MENAFHDQHGEHLLLTVLGTKPQEKPRPCYSLGGRQAEAALAPLALLELLPEAERPDRVLAICTREAKSETWPILERALEGNRRVESVDVPSGDTQEDIDTFLMCVTEAIPADADLTVDVTHGLRHFSFLTYIAVLHVAALRGTHIRGAYYGLLRRNDTSPFLDLRPLLQLPRWIHAIEVLRKTGSALPMAEAIDSGSSKAIDAKRQKPGTSSLARELVKISESYLSGLPLELGRHAHLFREQHLKPLRRQLVQNHQLPLADSLIRHLDRILEAFALSEPTSGEGWKRQVRLSEDELKRQARIIDDLLLHENVAAALGLMNEWTVSWVVLHRPPGYEWLDYPRVRRRAASLLGAIEAVEGDSELAHMLTCEQRALGVFWRNLCNLRNAYHHHGMRPQVLVGDKRVAHQLRHVREYWKEKLRSCPSFDLSLSESPGGCVLISPMGRRPGVLFSALRACRAAGDDPDTCIVICSHETERLIAEASGRAEYAGAIWPVVLEDPYGGRPEIERLVEAVRGRFIGAGEVFVNVTGGTTLMGLAAEALADAARRLACPVRRFGLIDRRPSDQQETDPYQVGEVLWLDPTEEGDGDKH